MTTSFAASLCTLYELCECSFWHVTHYSRRVRTARDGEMSRDSKLT